MWFCLQKKTNGDSDSEMEDSEEDEDDDDDDEVDDFFRADVQAALGDAAANEVSDKYTTPKSSLLR